MPYFILRKSMAVAELVEANNKKSEEGTKFTKRSGQFLRFAQDDRESYPPKTQ
jgi:hypothetical protein